MSGIVNKIKAKVEEVTHKDKTHTDPTHTGTHTGTTGTTHGTTGGLTDSSTHGTTGGLTGSSATHGTHGTTGGLTGSSGYGHSDPTGPHDSHLANQADPRVDSDRLGHAGNTTGAGGYGTTGSGLTGHSTTGHSTTGGLGSSTGGYSTTGNTTGTLPGSKHSDPTGPHDSKIANKLDPRVDSDQYGAAGNTSGAGGYGTGQYGQHNTTGGGLTGHSTTGHSTTGGLGSSTGGGLTGHNTTSSGLTGHSTTGHSTTGGLGSSTGGYGSTGYSDPTGPHDSHLVNKADPRVDSDRYGAAGNTSGAGGIGAGQYTEGHHGTTGHSSAGGIGGTGAEYGGNTGAYNDGTLPPTNIPDSEKPRALTEPYSKAEPHSALAHDTHHSTAVHDGQHSAGVNTHGKPSLKDKLNPKVDADGDGKAGFMK